MVEQLPCKQQVVGSIPTASSTHLSAIRKPRVITPHARHSRPQLLCWASWFHITSCSARSPSGDEREGDIVRGVALSARRLSEETGQEADDDDTRETRPAGS